MYLKGKVKGNMIENACKLPRILLQPNEQLYIVKDGKLDIIDIEVIRLDQNEIIVKGLEENTQVIAKPLARAIIGTEVEIITK